jgi:hypothetical protein
VENKSEKTKLQKRNPTVGDISRLLSALEYTPEEIDCMPINEVFEEINHLGQGSKSISSFEQQIKIIRGRVDSMSLYEITENELNILENGPPSSIYLNFAIFLLSIAISFLVSLLTTTITSERTFLVFVVITVASFISGFILLGVWFRNHRLISDIIARIKNRISDG